MKCDQCKELILTDYIDGQIAAEQKKSLEEHLQTCASCHEYAQKVMAELVVPFNDLERVEPPAALWENIKAELAEEPEEMAPEGIFAYLSAIWQQVQMPVLILSAIVIVIGVSILTLNQQNNALPVARNQQLISQMATKIESTGYDAGMISESELAYVADDEYSLSYDYLDEGYGSAIEEFFL